MFGDERVVELCAEPLADVEICSPFIVRPAVEVAVPSACPAVFVTPPTVWPAVFTTLPTVLVTPPSRPPPLPPEDVLDEFEPERSLSSASPTDAAAFALVIETTDAVIGVNILPF